MFPVLAVRAAPPTPAFVGKVISVPWIHGGERIVQLCSFREDSLLCSLFGSQVTFFATLLFCRSIHARVFLANLVILSVSNS